MLEGLRSYKMETSKRHIKVQRQGEQGPNTLQSHYKIFLVQRVLSVTFNNWPRVRKSCTPGALVIFLHPFNYFTERQKVP